MRGQPDPWSEGLEAYERLRSWFGAGGGIPQGKPAPLSALGDVRQLRYLLDQAELAAVQAARGRGASWAEIAAVSGIARQSAWERWREFDDAVPGAQVPGGPDLPAAGTGSPDLSVARQVDAAAAELAAQAAGRRQRLSNVTVPNVVGLSLDSARAILAGSKLVPVGPDPDGPPLDASDWSGGVVADQSPVSGAKVPAGSRVVLWLGRGGSAGDREPRRPSPDPRTLRAVREEPAADPTA